VTTRAPRATGAARPGLAAVAAAGVLAAAAITLAACGSSSGVKQTQDGKVTVSGTGRQAEVTVEGEQGTSITYNQRAVPKDYPAAVPRPEGATLRSAASGTRSGKRYFALDVTLGSTSPAAAIDGYATRLRDAGFTVTTPSAGGAALPAALQAVGDGWHVTALATEPGGGAPASMTVTVTQA
jgi:hypothetical protein